MVVDRDTQLVPSRGFSPGKLILPLYAALAETPAGLVRARAIYDRARPGYHPISADSIDTVLGVDR